MCIRDRDTVQSEIELRRALRVQTAQAKLSARVVSVLHFVLIAVDVYKRQQQG